MGVSIRWLWVAMIGGSLMLAIPGQTNPTHIIGDVVGHFFSAFLLAIVPIVGFRILYKRIGEKEITFIFAAAWVYLILSRFLEA
jgi:hypothetical protein